MDSHGNPLVVTSTAASGDERQQVEPLLDKVATWTGSLMERGIIPILEADKGYDSQEVRIKALLRNIFPWIPYRGKRGKTPGSATLTKVRWKVERGISWLQRKYRRLVVRWERREKYWEGFLQFGLIEFWIGRLIKLGFC